MAKVKKSQKENVAVSDMSDEDYMGSVSAKQKVKSAKPKKGASEMYQQVSQMEHVILRPDTYIGSVQEDKDSLWVWDKVSERMTYRETRFVPGLYKIFDEIMVNAADHKTNDPNMDKLDVSITDTEISVYNNGRGIPIEIHSKQGVYIPEMIFGNLLTSSNYDDDDQKLTGGRNGYGAKLANIFSTEFTVETADKNTLQKYKQTWTKNMSVKTAPKITSNSKGDEWTRITFKPDLARFGMADGMTEDMQALMTKRVYDMAGTLRKVKVYLNGKRLEVNNFTKYVGLYMPKVEEGAPPSVQPIFYSDEKGADRWEVAFLPSDGQAQQVSFCNGIATIKGGTHVAHVVDQLTAKIGLMVDRKNKAAKVKPFQIKSHIWIFVNARIINPTFDSQTKETLTLRPPKFGSKCDLSEDFVKKVCKSGVIDNILHWAEHKADQQMKKTDGTAKRQRLTGIAKLEDANWAGGKTGKKCTLILTEGDSAKGMAIAGISAIPDGRNKFGVFPLRGKLLNVREASHTQIMENEEIKAIRQILGLQHGKVYESTDQLRYGSLMIMTDQDHDGSHIKGLLINFFDSHYPSLLKIPGFLLEFITPILKVSKGTQSAPTHITPFYTQPEFEEWWAREGGKQWKVKYYKGLGTSTNDEARDYFGDLGKHLIPFQHTQDGDRQLIDMAFNKKRADDRKEWLRSYVPGTFIDQTTGVISLSEFINKELILFSLADNKRSIPSMVDGLKPGQRKIIFACFKRNLKNEFKVAQLSGYVSEHAAYHHGEVSLQMTIVNLAHDFVGSNNINLLFPKGQFGSRLAGGKDAASPRYIYTYLSNITRAIFHPADDNIVGYLEDDGQKIEPEFYMPVIPLVLVNGAEGIGSGWSTNVPNYNPVDLVTNLRCIMKGEAQPPLIPWFRGFKGPIEAIPNSDKFKVSGIIEQIDDSTYEITELPIKKWTDNYKTMLSDWINATEKVPAYVESYDALHANETVHFRVELTAAGRKEVKDKGAETFFKLSTTVATGNMVLFDAEGKIKKYSSPEEILNDFYPLRLKHYQMRKDFLCAELEFMFERLSNQARFILMIVDKKLVVSGRRKADIVSELKSLNFKPIPKIKAIKGAQANENAPRIAGEEESDLEEDIGGAALNNSSDDFDYLLSLSISTLTREKVDKLKKERDDKQMELEALLRRSPIDLWEEDLDNFLVEWEKSCEAHRKNKEAQAAKGKGKGKAVNGVAAAKAKAKKVAKKNVSDEDPIDDSGSDYAPKQQKKSANKDKLSVPKNLKEEGVVSKADAVKKPVIKKRKSDSLSDSDEKPVAAKARTTAAKTMDISSDDDSDAADKKTKVKPAAKKAKTSATSSDTKAKAAAKAKTEGLDISAGKKDTVKRPAAKPAAEKKKPGPAKKLKKSESFIDSSDMDSDAGGGINLSSPPPLLENRPVRRAKKAVYLDLDDDEDE